MKKYYLIIILTIYSSTLKADCLGCGTHFIWPLGNVITNNSLIIINSDDSNFIKGLSNKNFIYLKSLSDKIKIPLIITQICDGGLNLTQVVLKPSIQLVDGKEYGLYYSTDPIVSIKNGKKIKQVQKEIPTRTWIVKQHFDVDPPKWQQQPTIQRKFYVAYGCGPEIKIFLSFSAFDQSPLLVKAILTNKINGKETTCYIKTQNGQIELGHNMCCGEFGFNKEGKDDNEEYEVTFNLMDESGNISINSNPMKFVQPNQSDMQ